MSAQFPTETDRNKGKGFKLYEIASFLEEAINAATADIDSETGEISDDWFRFLDECQMARDDKALSIARYIKSLSAEAEAIKAEKMALAKRQSSTDNKAKRLKDYLAGFLTPGEKIKDANTSIGWCASSGVVVTDESAIPESCWKVERTILRTEVEKLIEAGEIPENVARIEKRQNISIK